jgi:hypothetical protein
MQPCKAQSGRSHRFDQGRIRRREERPRYGYCLRSTHPTSSTPRRSRSRLL